MLDDLNSVIEPLAIIFMCCVVVFVIIVVFKLFLSSDYHMAKKEIMDSLSHKSLLRKAWEYFFYGESDKIK